MRVRLERKRESEVEREKNIYISNARAYSNRAYMHGYCSTCAFMHNFTPINVGFFDQNV